MPVDVGKFSVVMPLYNKEATVERAIKSVFNQTVQDFEIIIVNDGSTDNSASIVESLKDPRIHLIHQVNQGVSAARNRGIAEAKYELIAFLDADDEWLPEFLETIRRMVTNYPDCGLYATRYFFNYPSGNRKKAIINGFPDNFEGLLDDYFKIAVRSHPPVWSSATCVSKKAINKIGGFPIGVKSGEDLVTWAKIAICFSIAYSMKCVSIFYQSPAEIYETAPSRIPDDDDFVGRELVKLLETVEKNEKYYLNKYCGLWHKMRASSYLRLDMKEKARYEIFKAFNHTISIKLLTYLVLSFLPDLIINKVFRWGSSHR